MINNTNKLDVTKMLKHYINTTDKWQEWGFVGLLIRFKISSLKSNFINFRFAGMRARVCAFKIEENLILRNK